MPGSRTVPLLAAGDTVSCPTMRKRQASFSQEEGSGSSSKRYKEIWDPAYVYVPSSDADFEPGDIPLEYIPIELLK